MQNERDNLIEEFITTTWDSLFRVPQTKLGVTDGGYCSIFASGHDLLERTREAIQAARPDFQVTTQQAFGGRLADLTDRPDLGPENMKRLGREYLEQLGEIVDVDLAGDDALVTAYGRMLEDYVRGEMEFNASADAPSAPRA